MLPGIVQKLRRDEALVRTPDGREGVPVTLQFRGQVPALERAGRRAWLQNQFNAVLTHVGPVRLFLKAETVSPSAHTVEAICPVDEFETATKLLEAAGLRVDVIEKLQVL